MTECDTEGLRDLLPEFAAEALSLADAVRVRQHLDQCAACAYELSLIRVARALRPADMAVNVPAIVARLPRPGVHAGATGAKNADASVVSLEGRRIATRTAHAARPTLRSVWRLAAALGVVLAGGWSVMMIRAGGLSNMPRELSDSLVRVSQVPTADITLPSIALASPQGSAVSFGDPGDLSDEELQRVLDRLDKWDGAIAAEAVTAAPLLESPRGGSPE